MAGKPKRMSQVKQILQLHKQGTGIKTIASIIGISKNTVKSYLSKYKSSKISLDTLLKMEDHNIEQVFHPGNPAYKDNRFEELKERLDYYVSELKKTGVTQQLLWEEYRLTHPTGYSLSQFSFHISQHRLTKNPSMVLHHEAGEKLFVDFAGKKLSYINPVTGEIIECQVFVACLPYSDFSFCMAVPSQRIDDFIYALTCCLNSLGGAPKVLVPDNLKSAVIRADNYEPTINQALEDFANHYNMAVIPARARKPKDKALVENQVKLIYTRVYARIRNKQFFSLAELNHDIREFTLKHNQTRMQNRDYCREEHFLSHEKSTLQELPKDPFEIKYYKEYKLTTNNHFYMKKDKHHYSAPYQYIGQKLKVVYTRSVVHVFYQSKLIAVHKRGSNSSHYTTCKDHLCSTHQHYLSRSPEYYQKQALSKSESLGELVKLMFSQNRIPEQLYRSCDGLFSLYKRTPLDTFNKACQIAIECGYYNYRFVSNVIKNRMTEYVQEVSHQHLPEHKNIRGKEYYNH